MRRSKVGLGFGDWLTGYTAFRVRWNITGTGEFSKVWFTDGAPWSGATPFWAQEFNSTAPNCVIHGPSYKLIVPPIPKTFHTHAHHWHPAAQSMLITLIESSTDSPSLSVNTERGYIKAYFLTDTTEQIILSRISLV